MVSRKNLNVPAFKVGNVPLFWLKEITSEWWCSVCKKRMSNAVSLQVSVKLNKDKYSSYFICMSCSKELLEEVATKVEIIERGGVTSFRLSQDM